MQAGNLHAQLPLALAVVLDPKMQQDRLYSTSRRSAIMLVISAGYFLHVSRRIPGGIACLQPAAVWKHFQFWVTIMHAFAGPVSLLDDLP